MYETIRRLEAFCLTDVESTQHELVRQELVWSQSFDCGSIMQCNKYDETITINIF